MTKQKAAAPEAEKSAPLNLAAGKVEVVERKEKEASTVNLKDADVVIGVGRGFGKQENVKLAEELSSSTWRRNRLFSSGSRRYALGI